MGLLRSAHIEHLLVVLHPVRDEVLLLPHPVTGAHALPSLVLEEQHPAATAYLHRELFRLSGLAAHVLRTLESQPSHRRVYAMEAEEPLAGSGAAAWAPLASLDRQARGWAERAIEGAGPAWTRRGFRARVVAWVDEALAPRGAGPVETVEQVRSWEFSLVIRFRAGGRDYFFKATPQGHADEGARVAHLAAHHRGLLPDVIAHDPARRWFLMAGVPGRSLEQVPEAAAWCRAAQAYAHLQLAFSTEAAQAPLALRRLTLDDLAAGIDALLASPAVMLLETPEGLTRSDLAALKAGAPRLKAWCRELAGLEPRMLALEHGDLWASNVLVTDRGPVFIDWTEAASCHPFLGLFPLLAGGFLDEQFGQDADRVRLDLTRAYLEPFASRYQPEVLRKAWDLALRLAPAFFAWRFFREVVPALKTPEMLELVPFFLKRLLVEPELASPTG
jgi:hypothetical protein